VIKIAEDKLLCHKDVFLIVSYQVHFDCAVTGVVGEGVEVRINNIW